MPLEAYDTIVWHSALDRRLFGFGLVFGLSCGAGLNHHGKESRIDPFVRLLETNMKCANIEKQKIPV